MRRLSLWLALLTVVGFTSRAHAGGYDTPILYSARHMGMGGTAISYVNDPSALFHNPAGLARIKRISLLANVSPLIGKINASPDSAPGGQDIKSETTFAPFFLVGGAFRITDFMVAGIGVYPVASAGAEFKYTIYPGESYEASVENRTKLLFIEASPGVAFNLPGNVTLGASYRMTYVSLERYQASTTGDGMTSKVHDFNMTGTNWAGFRLGAQWEGKFSEHTVRFGAQYRHKTVTEIDNNKGTAAGLAFTDISTKFVLPSKVTFGGRYDVYDFGVALDAEYSLNSQNKGYPLVGTNAMGAQATVGNPSQWSNSVTLRGGLEYRLVDKHLPVRAGYIWDEKTTNPNYPNAFGTPPGPSHVITAGTGWNAGAWQLNGSVAYRMAEARVNAPDPSCAFCGQQGMDPYKLWMLGYYVDFSYQWD